MSAMLLAGSLSAFSGCSQQGSSGNSAESVDFKTADKVADGAILQAFCWDFNTIRESMPDIAAAGFSAVQTSPINECLEGEDGDSFYLPVNFTGVLYGYDGSTMEKYAADHGLQFKSLGEKPEYELGNPTKFTANDSFITSDDASYILRLYSLAADGATKPTEAEMLSCDVNGDGFITADDASLVLRFYSLASAPDYKKTIVEFLSDVT